MSAEVIRADYEQLNQIAATFDEQAEALTTMLQMLQQRADNIVTAGWEGDGAEAFTSEMESTVVPAVRRLVESIRLGATATRQIIEIIEVAEQEAANPFKIPGDASGLLDGGRPFSFATRSPKKLDETRRLNGTYTASGPLFSKGSDSVAIHPNDISQGGVGDCYFVTSLATLADQNPGLIQNMVKDNGDGTYTVTLHEKQGGFLGMGGSYKPVEVVVTPEFPNGEYYSKDQDKWYPMTVTAGSGDSELWPRLVEKAYGQHIADSQSLNRVYDKLDDGGFTKDALTTLTGVESQSVSPDKYSAQQLNNMLQSGQAMTLSSKIDWGPFTDDWYNNDTLVRGHAYWVESVDVANNTVTVRNPWGYDSSSKNRIVVPIDKLDDNFREMTINPLK